VTEAFSETDTFCAPAACVLGEGDVFDDVHPAVHATRITTVHNATATYFDAFFTLTSDLKRENAAIPLKPFVLLAEGV
jgi:hypothetical protein